jgi:hypothetical protein
MKPVVIRFPPSVKLGEPVEKEDAILFPRMRERLADVVNSWTQRGYTVSNNRRGRLVVRKASRATFFFNRFRRGVK